MYFRRKPAPAAPLENTAVWSCEQEGCRSWMRDHYAMEHVPACPLCNVPMVRSMKMVPQLVVPQRETKKKSATMS
ncbi:cold-shock protein [Paenibacillus mucilaginosus]|uniref:Cold-shock protein n=3 Tax=Paenibacillus mucilaginosus TaxID=61624 RepID=H6NGL8_9BACL|nr:cold-shock protein [Paenibacillus mucilaginosus]AEI46320.1 hypothetical protein KNP414_07834 [Paenibacillus mucilaginosus KNP414]AFC33921.1 hypothetical protein PM3016_7353 [Paenibacillus mucilaginosus 3016]AFH66255.1 hypothetical protein B2K_37110 [Paenibacillus mucilaginosus K02]MCG7213566.1 cold-shock protein [Paenibacillus mucilaginosus]WDM27619.1 cold-shock protein [Paenibacillus mucilaginosus]